MESRVEVEVHEIKHSLEKHLNEINNEEQIFDLLCALERIQFTPKLIKETKLGNLVATIRGKFKSSQPNISDKAVSLLAGWKKMIEIAQNKKSNGDSTVSKDKRKDNNDKPTTAKFVTGNSHNNNSLGKLDSSIAHEKINSLSAPRRTIYNILYTSISANIPPEVAISVALNIEEALNKQTPAETMLKAYTSKAKSLAFNLKKNDAVRQHVVCGTISSDDVVSLSAADLASHEQKLAREKLQAEVVDARRSDWLEAHKVDIQADIGIDPNNQWEFDGDDGNGSEPDIEGD
eukprot:CAMPEP_0170377652 /NCGR_PEP_ID=MMETSP0117_2-20130122/12387_1 /TAXON_ID=400756 /ORGANISM="Durinskia baltica, Strain CSIRO CS-38" /LENGTH=289 /DNA_ID=CAMNT_0010632965 /DNA_START=45 /DNA_END=914 /DNA_ORIENTATION=+